MGQKEQIKLFEQKRVRSVWDEEKEEWFFSVIDVVEVLTDSTNPTDYLKKMRKRDPELGIYIGTNCPQVAMTTATGKKRRTLAANAEQLFRIIQSIPSQKAEPFKIWMAQVASQRLDQMQDPELSIEQAIADYMTNVELALNMLAEASTVEISKQKNPKGYTQSAKIAKEGGSVAKAARKQLESKTGKSAISSAKASDYLLPPTEDNED